MELLDFVGGGGGGLFIFIAPQFCFTYCYKNESLQPNVNTKDPRDLMFLTARVDNKDKRVSNGEVISRK